MKTLRICLILVSSFSLLPPAIRSDSTLLSANTVSVTVAPGGALTYSPSTVTILVGDMVNWTWATTPHTVVSGSNCVFDMNFSSAGTAFSHTFNQAGTFPYFCQIDSHCAFGMKGTVTVLTPFIDIFSVNKSMTGFTINGQTTATTMPTTVTVSSTSDLTVGFTNPTPVTANGSGAFTFTDSSGGSARFYRVTYP